MNFVSISQLIAKPKISINVCLVRLVKQLSTLNVSAIIIFLKLIYGLQMNQIPELMFIV